MKLEINEQQAQVISAACDLLSRIYCGQWGEVVNVNLHDNPSILFNSSLAPDIKDSLAVLKTLFFKGLSSRGASFGLSNKDVTDKMRIAYDIHQVLRHKLAWDNTPSGGVLTDFDVPLRSSLSCDLPKVE